MEALGTLAGGIAHDFNNILTSVVGFFPTGHGGCRNHNPSNTNGFRKFFQAGIRASDLVQQILTFARKTDMELKPVQISPLLKETIKFLRSTLPASIEIHEDIATNQYALADPVQIHQVIMNLATNAADAIRETGGELYFELFDKFVDQASAGQNNIFSGQLYNFNGKKIQAREYRKKCWRRFSILIFPPRKRVKGLVWGFRPPKE